jgi:CHAT domain-containing protein/Tfp pilus assembly protein PilF
MMPDGDDPFALLTAAHSAIVGKRVSDARPLLAAALPLIVARIAGKQHFTALASQQAAIMSLQVGDEDLARRYAQLVVGEAAAMLEERGTAARAALDRGDRAAALSPLRYAYLIALALVPFAPPQPRIIPSLVPGDPGAEPFNAALVGARRVLDAAGWGAWEYPNDVTRTARRWSGFAFTQIGGFLIARSADGRDVEDAQQLAEAAVALLRAGDRDQLLADALNLKGHVLFQWGPSHYEDAIPPFEEAIAVQRALSNEDDAAIDEMNLGTVYTEVASYRREAGQSNEAAASELAAETHLRNAIARFRTHDPYHNLAVALNSLSALELNRKRLQAAHDLLAEAWGLVPPGTPNRTPVAITFGALLLAEKNWRDAIPKLRVALDAISGGGSFDEVIKVHGNLGVALLYSGDPDGAEPYLSKAVDALESMQRSFLSAYAGMGRLKTHLWIYEAWIACLQRIGEHAPERRAAAFAAADRIKWLTFTNTLRFKPLRLPGAGAEPLIEKEQQLLALLSDVVYKAPAQAARTPAVAAATQQLDAIWDELAPRYPAHVAIRRGETVSASDAAALLDDDVRVLVEYFLGRDYGTAVAFVLQRGEAAPRIVSLPASPDELHAMVAELRGYGYDTPVAVFDDVLHRLHAAVLAPVLPFVSEGTGVCVVPHGVLHNVPFAALHDGTRHAVQRNAFAIVQSASALRWLTGKDRDERQSCLIFTATHESEVAGQHLVDLTLFEKLAVDEIAPLFATTKHITGPGATKTALLEELAKPAAPWNVAHIACHGKFEQDGLESFLVLAPDASGDNTLRALDIAVNVRPDTTLITLSACETGMAATATSEEVAGLAQAFLLAGSSSVLASLWLVQKAAGVGLSRRFYELWLDGGGDTPVTKLRALQTAQCDLLAERTLSATDLKLSHPYQWGPFQLYGDWT